MITQKYRGHRTNHQHFSWTNQSFPKYISIRKYNTPLTIILVKLVHQGVNGLVEYNNSIVSAVLQGGLSNQSFQRIDYFAQPDNPESETKNVGGGYVKGGANYNINDAHNVFFNAGFISRQPNFDGVFPNYETQLILIYKMRKLHLLN